MYYSAIRWLFSGYRPLLRSGQAVYGHFVGLIHKTVAVLMFCRELIQFACIQSQCHWKLVEQQLNSVCRPTPIHIAGIVCQFIHSLQQTQDVQQMLVYCRLNICDVAPTLTKHWCKLRLCLLCVSSLSDVCYNYTYRPIWGHVTLFLVDV